MSRKIKIPGYVEKDGKLVRKGGGYRDASAKAKGNNTSRIRYGKEGSR